MNPHAPIPLLNNYQHFGHRDTHLSPPPTHFVEVEGCGILKQMEDLTFAP